MRLMSALPGAPGAPGAPEAPEVSAGANARDTTAFLAAPKPFRLLFAMVVAMLFAAVLTACGTEDSAATDSAAGEPAMATLNGTVIYRERMALPVNATVNVRLLDVSRQDVPARVIDEVNIDTRGLSVPIPYTLEYDPEAIDERMSYAVRAEIRGAEGELLWTTDTVHPVLTRDAPADQVEVRVVRVNIRD